MPAMGVRDGRMSTARWQSIDSSIRHS